MSQITYPRSAAAALAVADSLSPVSPLTADSVPSNRPSIVSDDVTDLIDTLRASGLRVSREDVAEPFALDDDQQLAVYSIVQESLVNVLLHGDRKQNTVVLFEWSPTALALTIASSLRAVPFDGALVLGRVGAIDDATRLGGEGDNDVNDLENDGGGISRMRRRAQIMGGALDARAGYGRWVVAADFPRHAEMVDPSDFLQS